MAPGILNCLRALAPEFLKFQPMPRSDRRKHAADKQTTPDPTHAKTGTSCLRPGYADVAVVTASGLKMVLAWRKEALRPGPGFFAPDRFCGFSRCLRRNFKNSGASALKQFEIFRLRHRLNLFAKTLNVASKTRPRPSGFLGDHAQIRQLRKTHWKAPFELIISLGIQIQKTSW
ncbi:MAG: hypothetical protein R6U41_05980 [Desulfosalsimonas sp.]|uniref:hypothetical protein n=1 Tax=Desulfosalsimonas sp. TaxID=3073848 RepID=UPI003970E434